jgi:hypothetical protein
MTELLTIFIPVLLVCKTPTVDSCDALQYSGHYLQLVDCRDANLQAMQKIKNKVAYVEGWCINTQIPAYKLQFTQDK